MMSEWISVEDELPTSKNVLVHYKNSLGRYRIVKAFYAPQSTIESNSESDAYDEYDEEKDTYYLKQGWYECIDNWEEWSSIFIHEGEITHWMPLPEPPNDQRR